MLDLSSAILKFQGINLDKVCNGLDECLSDDFNFSEYFEGGEIGLQSKLNSLKDLIIKSDFNTLGQSVVSDDDYIFILGVDESNGYIDNDLCELVELIRAYSVNRKL